MALETLTPVGQFSSAEAEVLTATSAAEVFRAFASTAARGKQLTLMASRRSFGEQFLPPAGQLALDVSALDRGAQPLESARDGSTWVKVGGGTRFVDLKDLLPTHRAYCPPTSDRVSVAGALVACCHNSHAYFADSVRAFTLLTPTGAAIDCRADSTGLSRELYRAVPGSFGSLGVVTDLEMRMTPISLERKIMVHAVFAGSGLDGRYLDELSRTADSAQFGEGAGAVVYGNRRHAIVLGDELLPEGAQPTAPRALLTDGRTAEHAATIGLANRFPRVAEYAVRSAYPAGVQRWSPWYAFDFFQASYDRASEVLGRRDLKHRVIRALGVDPALPVCHQSWFFPREHLHDFMEVYWRVLAKFTDVEGRLEQQDLVLLPKCQWPCHSIGQTEAGVGVLTTSFAARRSSRHGQRISAFLSCFSRECHEALPGVRVSLCKQLHCETDVLRSMHASFIQQVRALRKETDPTGLLSSRFLLELGIQ